MDPTTTSAAEIRGLKREEQSAMASVVLPELYFANLSGARKGPGPIVAAALEEHFGGVDRWQREFVGAAQGLAGGAGWVLLSYSPHARRGYNPVALAETQGLPGPVPAP